MNNDEFRWKLASDSVQLVRWWAACISLHSNGRYGSALTGVSGRKNRNNLVIMAEACSLSGLQILTWSHGDGVSVWMSRWCNYTSKICFFSRANLKEYEVILQRAGLDRLCHEEVKTLRFCARHRYGMDKCWRPFKAVSVSRAQRTTHQSQKSWRDQPCHGQGGVSVVWYICADRFT